MKINATNRFESFNPKASRTFDGEYKSPAEYTIVIGGRVRTLGSLVKEFNDIRRGFNGPEFVPYGLDEITRDDLATEFAFEAYSEWDGTGQIEL